MNRRDFIRWLSLVAATPLLPTIAATPDNPYDVLQGISTVSAKLAKLSGNEIGYRYSEDAAFEAYMQQFWREKNGAARYYRTHVDHGLQTRACWGIHKIGEKCNCEPAEARWVSSFEYRRA